MCEVIITEEKNLQKNASIVDLSLTEQVGPLSQISGSPWLLYQAPD